MGRSWGGCLPPKGERPVSVLGVSSRGETRLPAPAPPAERTAGQLVGESMRLYGRRFWRALAIGIGPVAVAVVVNALARPANLVFAATGGAIVLSLSYVAASILAAEEEVDRRSMGSPPSSGRSSSSRFRS